MYVLDLHTKPQTELINTGPHQGISQADQPSTIILNVLEFTKKHVSPLYPKLHGGPALTTFDLNGPALTTFDLNGPALTPFDLNGPALTTFDLNWMIP